MSAASWGLTRTPDSITEGCARPCSGDEGVRSTWETGADIDGSGSRVGRFGGAEDFLSPTDGTGADDVRYRDGEMCLLSPTVGRLFEPGEYLPVPADGVNPVLGLLRLALV